MLRRAGPVCPFRPRSATRSSIGSRKRTPLRSTCLAAGGPLISGYQRAPTIPDSFALVRRRLSRWIGHARKRFSRCACQAPRRRSQHAAHAGKASFAVPRKWRSRHTGHAAEGAFAAGRSSHEASFAVGRSCTKPCSRWAGHVARRRSQLARHATPCSRWAGHAAKVPFAAVGVGGCLPESPLRSRRLSRVEAGMLCP